MPETVVALRNSLCVNDLLNGGHTADQARERKSSAIEISSDAKSVLHKWTSNVIELEDSRDQKETNDILIIELHTLADQVLFG